ncbi:YkgJ family cysteine cluster protein [Accumulibacter sp.]|uniref:YkgJ family cysteine cluster protein n=1 Tax=Accumulibacter sp. TaxID=2053492 RepID=UPI002CF331B7|nr:YkgJ family cysteine cluster protein [Accumulibacter sp.]HNC22157.1 YkgJ family cysteine cluster protein [Accumulibacter sp.]
MTQKRSALERPSTTSSSVDCRQCGACCATFRVSFYWAEADAMGLPVALVEPMGRWYACLTGTNTKSPRCAALQGTVGQRASCTAYPHRPSPCRELQFGDAKCTLARRRHGLPAIVATAMAEAPGVVETPSSNH